MLDARDVGCIQVKILIIPMQIQIIEIIKRSFKKEPK